MNDGFRASAIPSNLRKTIQNIKEITGNHSDDEIYAILKECSMDPNETAQKLLLQDTFHEVKRRRDRKKENQTNGETVDLRGRSGPTWRGGRGGRGNYTSRYAAQDAGVGRHNASRKENGVNQASEKAGSISSPAVTQEAKGKDAGSSVTVMANGPVGVVSGGTQSVLTSEVPSESVIQQPEMPSPRQSHIGASKGSTMASSGRDASGKMGGKSHEAGQNQGAEIIQSSSSIPGGSSSSRPSSNYGNRPQQATGYQKVGPNKEWKPKPTNMNTFGGHKTPATSDGSNVSAETCVHTQSVQGTTDSEEATNKLQKELEILHVRDTQHVIIPNHIHVPEALRTGLCFGSFDSAFTITSTSPSEPENQESLEPNSETHPGSEAAIEEQATSHNTLAPAEDADYVDDSQSTKQVQENVSSNDGFTSSSMPDLSDPKKETASVLQHSSVDTSASYNFGLMPAVLSNPLGALEGSETQARDVSRVPSYVQPVDPSSIYYAQVYRSGADNGGRISPFPAPGVATKYNGNVAIFSAQTSQSAPEQGGNPLVLSTEAQTPLTTEAAGVMTNSMAVTQQSMPLFRQPLGVHLPHYPRNYIPYGHYFSPFYVPPPTMHQFLGDNGFPQQAQPGCVYPGPPAAAAAASAVKFPLSQYKPGSNTGNSAHIGVGGSYGPYVAPSVGYGPGSVTTGNSTANEDLAASQFKESNMYITGQQTEGSAVWIPAPGREISSLSANPYYNLPPQGQHVTFAPPQAGQGTFAGIYHHPAQAVVTTASVHPLLQQSQAIPGAVDMVGPTTSIYQQPQHPQMNWPTNY